jgi:pyrophosphatase PpaX
MLSSALSNNKLENTFDVIVSADDTDKHKPDPAPLFIAIKRLDSKIENVVFVGDSDKDTGAAQNAKVPLFLFLPQQHILRLEFSKVRTSSKS